MATMPCTRDPLAIRQGAPIHTAWHPLDESLIPAACEGDGPARSRDREPRNRSRLVH
jgi:hypothetical protein